MIRVLLVIPTLDASGAEKQFTLLATGLPPDQFELRVIALTRGGPYETELQQAGIPVRVLGKRLKGDPVAWERLRREIRSFRPDIIHSWLFTANAYARLALPRRNRPKVIVSERCVDSWKSGWQLWLDRKLISRTTLLVANSHSVAEFYRQAGVPAERLRTIPNAVITRAPNASDRAAVRQELNLPPDCRIVLSVARLARQKRVDVLVWAMQLLRQLSPDVQHVIVGDGPLREQLQELARHYTCHDVTIFAGHRNDTDRFMAAADIFWFASEFEGQSNAIMEAMAVGLPVIASDIPPNRELIEDNVSGLLVRPEDSVAFAQYADRLLADRDWAKRLGEAARQRMENQHSVAKMVDSYAAVYHEALGIMG